MKIAVRWFPQLAVVVPDEEDETVVEAFEMLATNIARHLMCTRGESMAIVLERGERWLGARVHCQPTLARRERRAVLRLVKGLSPLFPWLKTPQDPVKLATDDTAELDPQFLDSLLEPVPTATDIQVFAQELTQTSDSLQQLSVDPDSRQKVQLALKKLLAFGTTRPRSRPPFNWPHRLTVLEQEFPAFADVIRQVVRPHLTLLAAGATRARMPPLLLVGPPGVGKSMFARELAKLLGTQALHIDMASATNNSALAGSSTFWANSQPGQLFAALAWGSAGHRPVADPVVILDEIDKTSSDRFDPLGPLYALLEPGTAATFEDQALPCIQCDASYIRWVMTANDRRSLPEPILSRVLAFDITHPTGQEMALIAQRMLETAIQNLGIHFEARIPDSMLRKVSAMNARDLKIRLECAIGQAIGSGRSFLTTDDFWTNLHDRPMGKLGFV
jgi:hypothetical protein